MIPIIKFEITIVGNNMRDNSHKVINIEAGCEGICRLGVLRAALLKQELTLYLSARNLHVCDCPIYRPVVE